MNNIVDLQNIKQPKQIKVMVNKKPTDLNIGDKLVFPCSSSIIRTITNLIISEDGSVNYVLKHWQDNELVQETYSIYDIILLMSEQLNYKKIGLC